MEKNSSLLFYTYADKRYAIFALPYAYFALRNNPSARVEILLEDAKEFQKVYSGGIRVLNELFPHQVTFTQSRTPRNAHVIPNTIRFIEQPTSRAEYLYIGDIDIMVMDDVLDIHLSYMRKFTLPFSNVIRQASPTPRLTGLHFCRFTDYYPLPDISDLDLSTRNDENVLYEIMRRKNLMVPSSFRHRPECGIHMSLSRDPLGRTSGSRSATFSPDAQLGWGGRKHYRSFLNQITEPTFLALYPHLDIEFRALQLLQEAVATERLHALQRFALAYLLDKRIFVDSLPESRSALLQRFHQARAQGETHVAIHIGRKLSMLWPLNASIWNLYAEALDDAGLDIIAAEARIHGSELLH